MIRFYLCRTLRTGAAALLLSLLSLVTACSFLTPPGLPPPARYALDGAESAAGPAIRPGAPTLVVSLPHAAAGYGSARMLYVRQAHKLEYFAQSEWVDTPANLLLPRITAALQRSGAFSAVLAAPSSAQAALRLDLDLVRLQQDFLRKPSQAQLTLRATMLDNATRQVLSWKEFDVQVPAASDDPYGGVVATNEAVRQVLEGLVQFCGEAARQAPSAPAAPDGKQSTVRGK